MGSYASRSGSTSQKPTNAVQIENMNEAQIDKEISKEQRRIASLDRVMQKNDIENTAEAKAMREAFPLGVGGDGWSEQRIKARNRGLERDAKMAKEYTEAYSKKKAAENRIEKLKQAKNEIKGTGKTQREVRADKLKQTVKSTPSTMKWKTTQKGGWSNGGYSPKIIKAGDFEIHGTSGMYSIYRNGKQIGSTSKLSTAKAYAEKMNKR